MSRIMLSRKFLTKRRTSIILNSVVLIGSNGLHLLNRILLKPSVENDDLSQTQPTHIGPMTEYPPPTSHTIKYEGEAFPCGLNNGFFFSF